MKFGAIAVSDASGAILAHRIQAGAARFAKGHCLTPDDLVILAAAGIETVMAARLDINDIPENLAAKRISAGLIGRHLRAGPAHTGRVNLYADAAGVLVLDPALILRLNRIDPALTLATLPNYARVSRGQMVATIKIIPFAAAEPDIAAWEALAAPLVIAPFQGLTVAFLQTTLPGTKPEIADKTTEITAARIAALGGQWRGETRIPHQAADIAAALAGLVGDTDLVLIAAASAISDQRDTVPAGIRAAGGVIEHFGMPVDPGNLLLLARQGTARILGLPGCARSPRLNGCDWVLERIFAGLPMGPDQITEMGVGGLLAEIPSRPWPRAAGDRPAPPQPDIAVIILAAGLSSRMGRNKLLIDLDGRPLIEPVIAAARTITERPIYLVVGHDVAAIKARLNPDHLHFISNPDYQTGLASSIRAGISALPDSVDAALICLGDMPGITPDLLARLIAGFDPAAGKEIIVPMRGGKRGNPVLWGRRFFPDLLALSGDVGGRYLIGHHQDSLVLVEAGDDGVLIDIDTPEALAAWAARHPSGN